VTLLEGDYGRLQPIEELGYPLVLRNGESLQESKQIRIHQVRVPLVGKGHKQGILLHLYIILALAIVLYKQINSYTIGSIHTRQDYIANLISHLQFPRKKSRPTIPIAIYFAGFESPFTSILQTYAYFVLLFTAILSQEADMRHDGITFFHRVMEHHQISASLRKG
jgi:hypothetical protein